MDTLAGGGVKMSKPAMFRFHNGDGWRYYVADGVMRTRTYHRPHEVKAAWDRGEVVPMWEGNRFTWWLYDREGRRNVDNGS